MRSGGEQLYIISLFSSSAFDVTPPAVIYNLYASVHVLFLLQNIG